MNPNMNNSGLHFIMRQPGSLSPRLAQSCRKYYETIIPAEDAASTLKSDIFGQGQLNST
jgi:hypothetical protein